MAIGKLRVIQCCKLQTSAHFTSLLMIILRVFMSPSWVHLPFFSRRPWRQQDTWTLSIYSITLSLNPCIPSSSTARLIWMVVRMSVVVVLGLVLMSCVVVFFYFFWGGGVLKKCICVEENIFVFDGADDSCVFSCVCKSWQLVRQLLQINCLDLHVPSGLLIFPLKCHSIRW